MPKISDIFDDISDFETLLNDAEAEAETKWEMDFVADMIERYDQYGAEMFLSEKQEEILGRIAGE